MAGRVSFHSQLSSIMETMARTALSQVCKLVDEDAAAVRQELSRLLAANSALEEKVNSLEGELTIRRSEARKLRTSRRSVGAQTVCYRDGDYYVLEAPTTGGIFGKDLPTNLWKNGNPYSLESLTASVGCEKSVVVPSEEITVAKIKVEDYVEDTAGSCHQEALTLEIGHEESMAVEPEQLPVQYLDNSNSCSLGFDPEGEQAAFAGAIEEPSMQMISTDDTEAAFSSHIVPIEEDEEEEDDDDDDDDDDDVEFVDKQQDIMMTAADGPSHEPQTLPAQTCDISTALDKDLTNDRFNLFLKETLGDSFKGKFTCKICSRIFFHKGTLTLHMKSHKSNFCSICKQHFPHKNNLKSHTCVPSIETLSKSCELCGKTFANPSGLRIHYVVHTGEKPYRCSFCDKGFTQKGNLKCHQRIHTGERPFSCTKCGRTFTQKVNLNQHLLSHRNPEVVGEKPKASRPLRKSASKTSQ